MSWTWLPALGLAAFLAAVGCGRDTTDVTEAAGDFEPAFTCEGLADRWLSIQQDFLDQLGDASVADLEVPSPRIAAAGQAVGNSLIEQARDAEAVGCDSELMAGSEALCSRVEDLIAHGPAGEGIIADLRAGCAE